MMTKTCWVFVEPNLGTLNLDCRLKRFPGWWLPMVPGAIGRPGSPWWMVVLGGCWWFFPDRTVLIPCKLCVSILAEISSSGTLFPSLSAFCEIDWYVCIHGTWYCTKSTPNQLGYSISRIYFMQPCWFSTAVDLLCPKLLHFLIMMSPLKQICEMDRARMHLFIYFMENRKCYKY